MAQRMSVHGVLIARHRRRKGPRGRAARRLKRADRAGPWLRKVKKGGWR